MGDPPIEVGVREGYARWAASYDIERNALIALEERHVAELLQTSPPGDALDLATGTGRHALRLASQHARVVALDQSPEMLAVGRRAAAARNLPIDFVLGWLEDALPFEAGAFDLVVCALALCHVQGIARLMRECARVLRPGGHLLITDFHPESVARGWRTDVTVEGTRYWLPNESHGRADYLDAVEAAGFELRTVRDAPVREIPAGYPLGPSMREQGDVNFCLIILASRK